MDVWLLVTSDNSRHEKRSKITVYGEKPGGLCLAEVAPPLHKGILPFWEER